MQTIHENSGDSRDKSYYQSNGVCVICFASGYHVIIKSFGLILVNIAFILEK